MQISCLPLVYWAQLISLHLIQTQEDQFCMHFLFFFLFIHCRIIGIQWSISMNCKLSLWGGIPCWHSCKLHLWLYIGIIKLMSLAAPVTVCSDHWTAFFTGNGSPFKPYGIAHVPHGNLSSASQYHHLWSPTTQWFTLVTDGYNAYALKMLLFFSLSRIFSHLLLKDDSYWFPKLSLNLLSLSRSP